MMNVMKNHTLGAVGMSNRGVVMRLVAGTLLFCVLWGCDDGGQASAPVGTVVVPVATIPAPTIQTDPAFSYDAEADWFDLDGEAVESLILADRRGWGDAAERRAWLSGDRPVSVIYLGDQLRIYHLAGYWQAATLGIVDEEGDPLWTVRLDLPPTGVVRGDMPFAELADEEGKLRVRLTMPTHSLSERGTPPVLIDRQIGVQAEPIDGEEAAALGYGTSASWEGAGPDGSEGIAAEAPEIASMLDLPGAEVKGHSWSAGTISSTTTVSSDQWKAIVLADRSSEFASHGGKDGEAPDESWWVGLVLGHAELESDKKTVPNDTD